jgi:hypothetical protein
MVSKVKLVKKDFTNNVVNYRRRLLADQKTVVYLCDYNYPYSSGVANSIIGGGGQYSYIRVLRH